MTGASSGSSRSVLFAHPTKKKNRLEGRLTWASKTKSKALLTMMDLLGRLTLAMDGSASASVCGCEEPGISRCLCLPDQDDMSQNAPSASSVPENANTRRENKGGKSAP